MSQCMGINWLRTNIALKPDETPKIAPAKVSVGKCTPNITRDKPTQAAHAKANTPKTGKNTVIIEAITQAPAVCPDGNENLSLGVKAYFASLICTKGLSRLMLVFSTQ